MKEFDFEELDRAVNSAIGGGGGRSTPPVRDSTPVPARDNAPAAPAARRSGPSGRFMDVMHPSTDMRGSERPAPAPVAAPEPVRPSVPTVEPDAPVLKAKPVADVVETPFISDAIVEKRPLGGVQPSDGDNSGIGGELIDDDLLQAEKVENSFAEGPTSENPLQSSTILSQTHTSQRSKDTPARSVYDTESYSKPAKDKKKSPLWIVLWVFLLLLLGAGTGAIVYFFILQPL